MLATLRHMYLLMLAKQSTRRALEKILRMPCMNMKKQSRILKQQLKNSLLLQAVLCQLTGRNGMSFLVMLIALRLGKKYLHL